MLEFSVSYIYMQWEEMNCFPAEGFALIMKMATSCWNKFLMSWMAMITKEPLPMTTYLKKHIKYQYAKKYTVPQTPNIKGESSQIPYTWHCTSLTHMLQGSWRRPEDR